MAMPAMGKARIALGVGFILLLIPLIGAAWDHLKSSSGACADKAVTGIPKTANMVYIEQKEIYLNSAVCIAVRGERYFKAERADIDAAILAVAAAEKEVAQAETQKLPEARTKLETARKALATAEAALATKSAAKPVYLFIDEVRTPSSMDVFTSDSKDVKDNKDGWTWKTLNIRAPDDAGAADGKLWRQILGGTPFEGSRDVTLAFGDKEGTLPRTDAVTAEKVKLRVYHWPLLVSGALGLALMAAGLIGLGWDTGLLRDTPPPPPAPPAVAKPPPFSLARVQFAWWLFLVIGGYLYVWLVTGQYIGVVTAGVLALMGISGASGLAAQVIDPTPNPEESRGFLRDIMSEKGTFVLQRVQMAAWTLILGVIFLWATLTSFSFPNFDTNLLVMAGIVNGVYLGFKFKQ
jgi:hypothetical protein